jgi:hypothetical protein
MSISGQETDAAPITGKRHPVRSVGLSPEQFTEGLGPTNGSAPRPYSSPPGGVARPCSAAERRARPDGEYFQTHDG